MATALEREQAKIDELGAAIKEQDATIKAKKERIKELIDKMIPQTQTVEEGIAAWHDSFSAVCNCSRRLLSPIITNLYSECLNGIKKHSLLCKCS
jgi:hypothetical protein